MPTRNAPPASPRPLTAAAARPPAAAREPSRPAVQARGPQAAARARPPLTGAQTRPPDATGAARPPLASAQAKPPPAAAQNRPSQPAAPAKPVVQAAPAKGGTTSPSEPLSALEFLQHLASEVSEGNVNLPCFPDVVIRIRQALGDPDTPLAKTVRIVGAEPRLAARLLQTANSVVFNPSGRPVTELRTAITRLGNRLVQSSAMAFAIQQLRIAPSLRAIGKQLKSLWEESVAVASICQVVARRTEVNPDEAFLAGLLHGIGRLYVMVRAADGAPRVRIDAALLEIIAGWHPSIGKAVLENWGFGEALGEAVANQYDYEHGGKAHPDHTDVLVVGVILAEALRDPAGVRDADVAAVKSFARLSLSPDDCRAVLRHTEHHIGALRAALGC